MQKLQALNTEIFIGHNLEIKTEKRTVFVIDEALKEKYRKKLPGDVIAIPNIKTQPILQNLLKALFEKKVERDGILVAVGGGNVTDLAAFAASIYMRGIDLILVPTTLLGMVDAAIGGKTAIDTPCGKNLIGTFYHPKKIYIDFDALQTLPDEEWFNGLAEIWKMGFIFDKTILEKEKEELIVAAIEAKIAIIQQDPLEQGGLRRILNFGHTFGHAMETTAKMPHGKAVALGCVLEAHLSMELGYLKGEDFQKVQAVYPDMKDLKGCDKQKILKALSYDKKVKGGVPRFVLMERLGSANPFGGAYCKEVMLHELEPTLSAYGL